MSERTARQRDKSRGRLHHLIHNIKTRNKRKKLDINLGNTRQETRSLIVGTSQTRDPSKLNKETRTTTAQGIQPAIFRIPNIKSKELFGTNGSRSLQSRSDMRKKLTQQGYTIKPNEYHPTRLQRVDNSYETGLALNKTIPNRRKDMIARYIKASFLQTYSDPKNNDPVQIVQEVTSTQPSKRTPSPPKKKRMKPNKTCDIGSSPALRKTSKLQKTEDKILQKKIQSPTKKITKSPHLPPAKKNILSKKSPAKKKIPTLTPCPDLKLQEKNLEPGCNPNKSKDGNGTR